MIPFSRRARNLRRDTRLLSSKRPRRCRKAGSGSSIKSAQYRNIGAGGFIGTGSVLILFNTARDPPS